ncbi:HAMP domain-containing sensor histidine kinase [Clostridium sp. chh4-2]|uniref:sensor histidine kinase n=1 Tax=Clostridium sp. chh4-2 TaxID=2067550 RepID=UPI001FA83210|nr:HAMP domain-containing sensor histidine kinase [Clostridium sp. chh4-2]
MKSEQFKMQFKKGFVVLLHLFFVVLVLAGFCFLQINDNSGKGLAWLNEETYEDTPMFSEQLRSDITNIFNYVNYKDLFETNGEIDYTKDILSVRYNNKRDVTYTLDELVRYAKARGFYLDENFKVVKNQAGDIVPDRESLMINWKAYLPNEVYAEPGDQFATLEELSREVLEKLGEYYTIRFNFIEKPTNLYFRVAYQDSKKNTSIYTNSDDMTFEEMAKLGKFLYLSGDAISPVTNIALPPNDVATLLEKNNPYDNFNSSIIVAIDTSYPHLDAYSIAAQRYRIMHKRYVDGFVMLVMGILGCMGTVLYLIPVSGHKTRKSREISLHHFDRIPTEAGVILYGAAVWAALYMGRMIGYPLLHLLFKSDHWAYLEQLSQGAVMYVVSLTAVFSVIRRYKAASLWKNSIVNRFCNGFSAYLLNHSFKMRIIVCYLAFLAVNVSCVVLISYLYYKQNIPSNFIKFWGTAALLILIDLAVFLKLLQTSMEKDKIDEALKSISTGDTGYKVDLDFFSGKELAVAESINNISSGLENALQEKVKSERLKADLITNVSHDIKTPLTSIINYVDLIKREHIQDPKIQGYLEVLDQKSQRLKTLTEDLVEASKASSGNVKLEIANIDLVELVWQTNGEFDEKFALRHLEVVTHLPDQTLLIEADGRHLWRVLENLYNNAYKYAMEGSRVYIDVQQEEDLAVFTIKNVSANPLNINADELTERFVRGDVARTTEGSGLGLSIAKSLTELQNGIFKLYIDGDLFKAQVSFPIKKPAVSQEQADLT